MWNNVGRSASCERKGLDYVVVVLLVDPVVERGFFEREVVVDCVVGDD
jgi:hypothetical protein